MQGSAYQVPTPEKIREVVDAVLPEKRLYDLRDRGQWVRQIYELKFEAGDRAFMKLHVHPDWLDSTANEAYLCEMLRNNNLPAPETLFLDPKGEHLGFPFIIQTALQGKPLSHWLTVVASQEWPALFSAVGEAYAQLHEIKGPSSGVWDGSPEKTLPVSPNDFYLANEIINGSGKAARHSGRLSQREYDKIIDVWKTALPQLKSHEPSLVHGSAFPWTVCLSRIEGRWQVSRLNALGDFLWWDPAYDQACLVYPPGHDWPEDCLKAFWNAYGVTPEPWRINLYALLQHLCALNAVFMPPSSVVQDEPEIAARVKQILAQF